MKKSNIIQKIIRCHFFVLLFVIASVPLAPLASALTGADFQAGNIISGAVFTNFNAMGASDIQAFLDSKVPVCDTAGSQPSTHWNSSANRYYTRAEWGQVYNAQYNTNVASTPFVCLKNYIENPSTKQNNLLNPNVYIPGGQTAAQIIYNTAQAYKINPEVLIITLQKEQGLVTDDWPWTNEYSAAMGYACPDDGTGCHSQYAGFAKQVDSAGWQYRDYLNNPNKYNFSTGNNFVLNNTTSSGCASNGSIVNIQNLSTAALYDYTPYQPDSNVLSHTNPTSSSSAGSVTGDNCAAYGNRNFWWYFTKWFGSTQTTIPYAWNFYSSEVFTDSAHTQRYATGNEGVISIAPGNKAYIRIRALNNGNQTWNSSNFRLGTSSPHDRCSVFNDSSWLSCYRIQMVEPSVAPGDTGTFDFSLTAPSQLGSYREYFNPVADGITWLNDPLFYLQVDVVNPHAATNSSNLSLQPEQTLLPGHSLMSPDAQTSLVFQADGNLVLYSDFLPVWSSGTSGKPATKLVMQGDGNLVLYDRSNNPLWSSNTYGNTGAYLNLLANGAATVTDTNSVKLWSTGNESTPDHLSRLEHILPADTFMMPGQELDSIYNKRLIYQVDGNLVLYSAGKPVWASNTSGTSASVVRMQSDGNLVIYDASGRPVWSSGTGGRHATHLRLQDDGNLVVYDNFNPIWSSGTYGK